jgi:hypothetical protein
MDDETFEEFSFEKRREDRWLGRNLNLLLVAIIVVATLLWWFAWPTPDPCKGAPAGSVVEDLNNAGTFKQCKG